MIEIHAFDLGFEPAAVTVAQPGVYTVQFINDGGVLHDLTFMTEPCSPPMRTRRPPARSPFPADGLAFHCSVPGHADAGMTGTVSVGEEGAPQPSQT